MSRVLILAAALCAVRAEAGEPAAVLVNPAGVREPAGVGGRTGGNVIYYLFLPSTNASFGAARLKSIVDAGNVMLTTLGVRTRMVGIRASGAAFDPSLLDPKDRLAVLGDKAEIMKMLTRVDPDAGYVQSDWSPEGANPEISDRPGPSGGGKWTVVDSGAVKMMAGRMGGKAGPEMVAALFAIHGVGHQCGIGHPQHGNFMDDGSRLTAYISGSHGYVDEEGILLQPKGPGEIRGLFRAEDFATMTAISPRFRSRDRAPQRSKWTRYLGDEEPVAGYAFKAARRAAPAK